MISFEGDHHIQIHRLVQTIIRHQHLSKVHYYPSLTLEWDNVLLVAAYREFSR